MQEAVDARIQAFYGVEFDEGSRLDRPAGRLELARVQELLRPRLPAAARIADIGGGTGVHAQWLTADGHSVTLVDPVPRHVNTAAQIPVVTALLGDARSLALDTDSFDAALLFGPLYHLESRADRIQAIQETARIVRPGGLVFAAVIPRWAVYSDSMTTLADGAGVPAQLHTLLDTGESPLDSYFPGAHFHTSAELEAEMTAGGLAKVELVAIEGPGGLPLEFLRDASEATITAALELVRAVGTLDGPREMTAHLMAIGQVTG